MQVPGVISQTLKTVRVRFSGFGAETGKAIVVDSSVTDTGSTPNNWIRPGLVVAKHASDGRYYAADSANAKKNGQASIASLVAIGAGAASDTFKWKYKGGEEQTVTGGAGDDTAAEWVTALNADADFSADLIASAAGSTLTIKSKRAGADEYFEITTGTLNDQGGAADDTFVKNTQHAGTDGDYLVLDSHFDVKDANNVAVNALVTGFPKGHFDESELRSLTKEARAVLQKNGSIFA